jgi:hypothetical protein
MEWEFNEIELLGFAKNNIAEVMKRGSDSLPRDIFQKLAKTFNELDETQQYLYQN